MTKDKALRLALEALEKLWNIIDDIDTYSDMAKADEKLYRSLVERRQRQRFEETGISTDGYELHGGAITAIKAALEAKDEKDGSPCPEFWDWLPKAYRDGDIGDLPKFTKYNMEVAFLAGKQSVALEAKDEPVAQPKVRTGNCLRVGVCASEGHKIQPQRTWVGLTDEDIEQEFGFIDELLRDCVQRTEAKLRSKND